MFALRAASIDSHHAAHAGTNFAGLQPHLIWKGSTCADFVKEPALRTALLAFALVGYPLFSDSFRRSDRHDRRRTKLRRSADFDPKPRHHADRLNIFKNIYNKLTDIAANGTVRATASTFIEGVRRCQGLDLHHPVQCEVSQRLDADDQRRHGLVPEKIMKDKKSPVRAYLIEVALRREGRSRQGPLRSDGPLRARSTGRSRSFSISCRARPMPSTAPSFATNPVRVRARSGSCNG